MRVEQLESIYYKNCIRYIDCYLLQLIIFLVNSKIAVVANVAKMPLPVEAS